MIEHQINNDTRDRDVPPDRKGPAGNFFMPVKPLPEGAEKRNQCQRDDCGSQDNMAYQDSEIDRTNESLALKCSITCACVINKIGNQEENRHNERRKHGPLMRLPAAIPDKNISDGEEYSAGCV